MQATPLEDDLAAQTKLALRRLASAVAIVTCRKDDDGDRRQCHEHATALDLSLIHI